MQDEEDNDGPTPDPTPEQQEVQRLSAEVNADIRVALQMWSLLPQDQRTLAWDALMLWQTEYEVGTVGEYCVLAAMIGMQFIALRAHGENGDAS